MSGTPTEAEVQTMWRNAIDVIETLRAHADGTHAGAAGKWDVLLQSLEGEFTPAGLSAFVNTFRAGLSDLVSPGFARSALEPVMFEYANILAADATLGYGSGFTDLGALQRALYEWFVAQSLTVESRAITYDTTATAGASNVGNGAVQRLTEDENAFDMEACHVEKKTFRCRADQNSGVLEHAEVFEVLGEAASFDNVLRAAHGSGDATLTEIVSKHAGAGAGGSLLANSSFSEFDSTASPKFSGWTETSGAANIAQDTTNFYRSHPNAQVDASLRLNGDALVKQTLESMRISRLDPDTPYFLRLMWNRSVGTGTGGTLTLRLGSTTASVALAAQSGWQELVIAADQDTWFRQFNEDPFDVEIEWASSSSGYVLVDDVIFAPYDLIDGTWWCLRGNAATHTPWLVDDTLTFTDTGGAPATGKIQYWHFISGLGYLPSSGAPTHADP